MGEESIADMDDENNVEDFDTNENESIITDAALIGLQMDLLSNLDGRKVKNNVVLLKEPNP